MTKENERLTWGFICGGFFVLGIIASTKISGPIQKAPVFCILFSGMIAILIGAVNAGIWEAVEKKKPKEN